MTDWVSVTDVTSRLDDALPEGLHVERAVLGHLHQRHRVEGIDYRITGGRLPEIGVETVQDLLEREAVWVERERKKSRGAGKPRRIDIRPFIRDITVDEQGIHLSLEVTDRGTTRPEEVVALLGVDPGELLADCTVTRMHMRLVPSL